MRFVGEVLHDRGHGRADHGQQEVVERLIVELGLVEDAEHGRVVHGEHEAVILPAQAVEGEVVVALGQIGLHDAILGLLDLDIDAQLAQLLLDDLSILGVASRGHQRQRERLTVLLQDAVGAGGVTGVGHQLLGLLQVITIADLLDARPIAVGGGRDGAFVHLRLALLHDLHQHLAVDGQVDGLAHVHVVERRFGDVHEDRLARSLVEPRQHLILAVGLQALDVLRLQHHVVHLAGFQAGQPGGVFGQEAELDGLDVGCGAPAEGWPPGEIRVAFQHDLLARHPLLELERADADGLAAEVIAQLFSRGLGQRLVIGGPRENVEQGGVGLGHGQLEGVVVDRLGLGQAQEDGAGCGRRLLGDGPVERIGVVLGGQRRAIVELDVVAQLELVAQAVLRHRPLGGQVGQVLAAVRVFGQQAGAHELHDGVEVAGAVYVERGGFGGQGDDHLAAHGRLRRRGGFRRAGGGGDGRRSGLGAAAGRQQDGDKDDDEQRSESFHGSSPV